jgi:hypothetical protein
METPGQTGGRLLAALDDLVTQEAAAVLAGDYGVIAGLQARTAAVGEKLSSLAGDPTVAALRLQVEALLERREQTQRQLTQRLTAVRLEIERLRTVRLRVTRLGPAYGGRVAGAAPRFTAAA